MDGLSHSLTAHPASPPLAVRRIEARAIGLDANWLRLRWRIEGAGRLVVPAFAGKGRADELWRSTCFEAFLRPQSDAGADGAYVELNLSPSQRWAAYDFTSYRSGMAERAFPREPVCTPRIGQDLAIFDAAIPIGGLPELPCAMGLCAVIEEEGGNLSYWALAHGGDTPDFHHPACFAATLAPPEIR